ncbi:GNAT family N-acetyltransferase [Sutterella sp.]|uniref:GNAT family N-acetyltransferase n=1 Tax=Sutterella sp. TaxID=1981025 RepID=UPI0026E045A0|nr:GNAT family N-acetyltransferase [Sutterella sp.]MDO5532497.1 GNAT family N-acetyltransferase [Sutterella sp.]
MTNRLELREITAADVPRLRASLIELAAWHNSVSEHFGDTESSAGAWPVKPFETTLAGFDEALRRGTSRIAVIESDDETRAVIGFAKVDIDSVGQTGKIDYLVVRETFRGRGHGSRLMEWAMATLRRAAVTRIEVKVVAGNDGAIRLYEKHGFRVYAHLLWKNE